MVPEIKPSSIIKVDTKQNLLSLEWVVGSGSTWDGCWHLILHQSTFLSPSLDTEDPAKIFMKHFTQRATMCYLDRWLCGNRRSAMSWHFVFCACMYTREHQNQNAPAYSLPCGEFISGNWNSLWCAFGHIHTIHVKHISTTLTILAPYLRAVGTDVYPLTELQFPEHLTNYSSHDYLEEGMCFKRVVWTVLISATDTGNFMLLFIILWQLHFNYLLL